MTNNLRAYELAVAFYKASKLVRVPGHLRNQLQRAASSVALNLAEGSHKSSRAEQRRFFEIALASVREVSAVCDLEPHAMSALVDRVDHLGASIYRLIRSLH